MPKAAQTKRASARHTTSHVPPAVAQLLATSFATSDEAIDAVLATLAQLLDSRTLFLARFDAVAGAEPQLNVLRVLDRGGCPLRPGIAGPVVQTYCNTIACASAPLLIEDTAREPFYRGLPATEALGIGSYIGVPLLYSDGRVYGTLCGIDPRPLRLRDRPDLVALLQILARLLISQIERDELNARLVAATALQHRFLTTMTHELRTPLTAILGTCQYLQRHDNAAAPDKVRPALERMEQSAQRMVAQITDLLDYSKARAGQVDLSLVCQPLTPLISAALDSVLGLARQREVHLTQTLGAAPSDAVAVDAGALHRVLLNLLGNALAFTPAGGHVRVALTAVVSAAGHLTAQPDPFPCCPEGDAPWVVAPSPDLDTQAHGDAPAVPAPLPNGVWLGLHVVDDGRGMPATQLPLIFDEFRQVRRDDTVTRPHAGTGTGLGLAIVAHLVRLMHGFVAVRSVEGRGSCFTVLLPLHPPATPPVAVR